MRNFAAECAASGASDTLVLVFVLSACNLEHDYLGLLAVLETREMKDKHFSEREMNDKHSSERETPESKDKHHRPAAAERAAQPPAQGAVRQRVHAMLRCSR